MEKKELTKQLLGESFRHLLETTSFEKITIHMITDDAGVIRPTFYHYFKDKYEVVEWIFEEEIGQPVREMLASGMYKEAVKMLFVKLDENRPYYKKIFMITGQNSFIEILEKDIYSLILDFYKGHKTKRRDIPKTLTDEAIAQYYTMICVNIIKQWVQAGANVKTQDLIEGYAFLLFNSVDELIEV